MTPERLNELAEMIEHDEVTVKEGREIAAYLRECAKAEPVATVCKLANGQHDIAYKTTDLNSLSVGTKLYPAPQVLSSIDERAEFEKWANENKGGEPLQLGDGGTYPNPFANAAFEAWQARAKLSAPEGVSKTTDTEVAPATAAIVPDAELFQAIARGWCHDANKQKEMDVDLALAIAEEVKAMLKGAK